MPLAPRSVLLNLCLAAAVCAPGAARAAPVAAAAAQSEPVYIPPADVPIPQPKILPPKAESAPAEPAPALPQNPPLPSAPPAEEKPSAPAAETKPSPPAPAPAKAAPKQASPSGAIGLADAQKLAQALADKFSQVKMMTGDFVQFDPRGGMSNGTFYLERPGRILFDYQDTPLRVICDGTNIAVNNRRLRSWSLYELDKSPLNLLLADKINIANGRLLEFTQEPNATIMVLGDDTGRAKIRLIFDAQTAALKQWTMTENGQDTTIQIMNVRTDIAFEPNMFNINYYRYPKKR